MEHVQRSAELCRNENLRRTVGQLVVAFIVLHGKSHVAILASKTSLVPVLAKYCKATA